MAPNGAPTRTLESGSILPVSHISYYDIVMWGFAAQPASTVSTPLSCAYAPLVRPASNKTWEGLTMTDPSIRRTDSGRTLTDADLEALATEVAENNYDVDVLTTRRRGRPPMGSGPAGVVPVRIDPELLAAVKARAEIEHATISEIIREAIRRFLDVA